MARNGPTISILLNVTKKIKFQNPKSSNLKILKRILYLISSDINHGILTTTSCKQQLHTFCEIKIKKNKIQIFLFFNLKLTQFKCKNIKEKIEIKILEYKEYSFKCPGWKKRENKKL